MNEYGRGTQFFVTIDLRNLLNQADAKFAPTAIEIVLDRCEKYMVHNDSDIHRLCRNDAFGHILFGQTLKRIELISSRSRDLSRVRRARDKANVRATYV